VVDTQHSCLSKIILDGEILPFIEAKINAKFFPDPEHRKVFELVMDHYGKYGNAPTPEVVAKAYPTYKLADFPEPVKYYLNQLQQDRKKVVLTEHVQQYVDRMNADPGTEQGDDLELILRKGMAQAAHEISHGKDTDFFLNGEGVISRIRERAAEPGKLRGFSTGFPTLDEITGGLQKEHLITFVGLPKAGKSSMLLKMAYHVRTECDAKVLFLTFEMSTEEQEDRLLSIMTGIDLTSIDRGNLDKRQLDKIEKAMNLYSGLDGFTITSDISSALTLSGVQAKVNQYQPDLLIVDGMYLMDDETGHDQGSPQALTALTRGFKRMAQNLEMPIIVSTQALAWKSKNGLTENSIGYSSSFLQDSDKILGAEASAEVETLSKLKTLLQRAGRKGTTYVEFDWSLGRIEEIPEGVYEARVAQAMPPTSDRNRKGGPAGGWDND
jgi:replicative DNA helicase